MGENENVCVNPLEEQRRSALEHYKEISSRCGHWSGFVEAAIKAYQPFNEPATPKDSLKTYSYLERLGRVFYCLEKK